MCVERIEYLLNHGAKERLVFLHVFCVGSLGSDAREDAMFAHIHNIIQDFVLEDTSSLC